jgi:hypothetical protein
LPVANVTQTSSEATQTKNIVSKKKIAGELKKIISKMNKMNENELDALTTHPPNPQNPPNPAPPEQ